MKKKEEFKKKMVERYREGKLITGKHDPTKLDTEISDKERTVLSLEVAKDFEPFMLSGQWDAVSYQNKDFPNNPYIVITPHASSGFRVPASGVAPMDPTPSTDCDLLVTVSGYAQGWHIFGESSAELKRKISDGTLLVLGSLD